MAPGNVRAGLPEGLLDLVKEDPRSPLDPAAAQGLKETLAGANGGDVSVADNLLDSLNLALAEALNDVFAVLWVAVAVPVVVALFLRVQPDTNGHPKRKGLS